MLKRIFSSIFNKSFVKRKNNIHKCKTSNNIAIECDSCDGVYKLKDGRHGIFAGCSNYPVCRSTKNVYEIVLKYIQKYGVNIYKWERECYKCKKITHVYSYYLYYQLYDLFEELRGPTVGLGDVNYIDNLLSKQIKTIKSCYSNVTKTRYMANVCEHCGALQGRNYIVDDPHEIIVNLDINRDMERFLFQAIDIKDTTVIADDIKYLYNEF